MSVRSTLGRFGIVTVDAMRAILDHDDGSPTVLALYVALSTHADRDEESSWRCSNKSLAEEAGISERSVRSGKAVLVDLGLLEVTPNFTTDGDRGWDSYLLHFAPGQAHDSGGPANGAPGGASVAAYSSDQETDQETDSLADARSETPIIEMTEPRRLCELLSWQLKDRGYKNGTTVTEAWVQDMDRLIRIDGREPGQIEAVLHWLHTGSDDVAAFWRTNIRSPKKLRAQWDSMREKYEYERRRVKPRRETPEEIIARVARGDFQAPAGTTPGPVVDIINRIRERDS